MADIEILPFQPILFRNTDEISDCVECNEQPYCQIVAETDQTQFQIKSSNIVVNGNFEDEGESWVDQSPMVVEITSIENESEPGECDGSVNIVISGYTGTITITHIDGVPFGFPVSASATLSNICEGCHYYTFKDSAGKEASIEFCLVENIICGDYSLTTDFEDVNTMQLANCYTTDFV